MNPAEQTGGPDRSRGLLQADLTMTGPVGDLAGLRGRGTLRASGGPVVAVPLLLPLIEFSNLRPPSGEELDLAEGSFYFQNGAMSFDALSISSGSIEILGAGEIVWPGAELDFRLRSVARRRIPVISEIVEGIRDELVTTRLTGTLTEARIVAEQFTDTRWLLGGVFGSDTDPALARLRQLEAEAAKDRGRRGIRPGVQPESGSDPGRDGGKGEDLLPTPATNNR